ncbi:MAG: hypothetical protein ACMXX8_01960 [Candidatus Woesearchaeota archaeon]
MFFIFRGRVIEIRKNHIILFLIVLFLILINTFSFIYLQNFFIPILITSIIILLITLLFTFISSYYLYELSFFIKNNKKKVFIVSSLIVFIPIIVILISSINFPEINLNGFANYIPLKKQPSVEFPSEVQNHDTTTSTKLITTTTIAPTTTTSTTTTSSTTTTTLSERDRRGFFVTNVRSTKKDEPKDCSFNGRGHDAVLMPSGNYYCRSTQQRISIYVDGVEKICCVTV